MESDKSEEKKSVYYWALVREVLKHSESKRIEEAFHEWYHLSYEEDKECAHHCVCGKKHIKELNRLRNSSTGAMLFPVGSVCVKQFSPNLWDSLLNARRQYRKVTKSIVEDSPLKMDSGVYKDSTYEEIGYKDPQYAMYLMRLNLLTVDENNPSFRSINLRIRKHLQRGIDASKKCMLTLK